MNRDGHPMGLCWLSLILFGLSFVVPPDSIIPVGHSAKRLAEPDVLHGAGAVFRQARSIPPHINYNVMSTMQSANISFLEINTNIDPEMFVNPLTGR